MVSLAATSGCSLSLGATGTRVLSSPQSSHVGPSLVAQLRKPRGYEWMLGMEEAILTQPSPSSSSDQWRVAGFFGYSRAPLGGANMFGWEAAVRAGFLRGPSGDEVPYGGLLGLKMAPLIRISADRDPWERDELLDTAWMLVPEIGVNGLFPRFHDASLEVTATLAARLYLGSSVIP
jgi:hypothetical protein